jgi:uncharacterized protein (DUF1330 family)
MAKAYWIAVYHKILDPARMAQYAALAGPALEAGGGRFIARGTAAHTLEGVENQRAVILEFESVAQAVATYNSPQYAAARAVLQGAVERDVRILDGVG